MMANLPDQDAPVGSNSPPWNIPRSAIGSETNTPFNIQEFRKSSAGMHIQDVEEGKRAIQRRALGPFGQW